MIKQSPQPQVEKKGTAIFAGHVTKELSEEEYTLSNMDGITNQENSDQFKLHPLFEAYHNMLTVELEFYVGIDKEEKAREFIEKLMCVHNQGHLNKIKGFNEFKPYQRSPERTKKFKDKSETEINDIRMKLQEARDKKKLEEAIMKE